MTTADPNDSSGTDGKVPPEALELRARPQPVTRINRKVLIGGAAVLLFLISAIVLVALKPPSLRIAGPQELFNVDHKPITDGLSKLPATYDGMKSNVRTDAPKLTKDVPELTAASVRDVVAEAERVEKARLARMAGARIAGVLPLATQGAAARSPRRRGAPRSYCSSNSGSG
jgi:type IV secretion system protein TrbI